MSEKLLGLGALQFEIMELVWAQEEATVSQLVEAISKQRPITYTTALSAAQKLEKKGWLKHRSEGRAYVYRAVKKKTDVGKRRLGELLKAAFSSDPKLLLSSLIDEAGMSDEELSELRKLIDEKRKKPVKRKGRRNG